MRGLTLAAIASACGGQYVGDEAWKTAEIQGVETDSRKVEKGFLFVPVVGERVDGHNFIPQVFQKGGLATLSEKPLEECPGPYIQVKSSLQALKDLAAFYRSQLTIPVIGVVGSVGKTSTKEMVASVLSVKYKVLKTEGNFNNEIGLPLTLLRIQENHEAAVVEMGISDFGEMHRLGKMACPSSCVITNIGTCHLENLRNRDGVLKAKTEIFDHLKDGAAVFLNGDDDKLATVEMVGAKKPVFFGIQAPNLDISVTDLENLGLSGSRALLVTTQGSIEIEGPLPGIHNLYNAMAAAGIGLELGLTLEEIREGIKNVQTIQGRSNFIHVDGVLVIDDCYNANPVSMKASLDVLREAKGRTVAVLGDMGELGDEEKKLHWEVGVYAAQSGIDKLICVGALSREMVRGAREAIENRRAEQGDTSTVEVAHYATKEEMIPDLLEWRQPGDTILVKASHFMNFQEIVKALTKN